jgi:Patatin-like phospholipase
MSAQDVWLATGRCPTPPKRAFVGVAITGGGIKSATYATEVLFELRRYGLLHDVDIVSSVSGGSFTALVYGLSCDPEDLACEDPPGWVRPRWQYADMTRLTETDFLWPFVLTRFLPNHLFLNVTTYHGSADDMADVISSRLLQDRDRLLTFRDLETKRPNLILNATNMTQLRAWFDQSSDIPLLYKRPLSDDDALHFSFTQQYFWRLLSNLNRYPLRDALVASAAFPLIIDRPSLRHFRVKDLRELRPNGSPPTPDYIALTDGGVHDNFGVTEILWFLECQFPTPPERSNIEPALYQRECGRPMPANNAGAPSASLVLGINSSLLRSEGTPADIPKQRSWDVTRYRSASWAPATRSI